MVKKCIECNITANFNVKGKPALYCFKHKLDNMINVYKKTCIYDGCTTLPNYNFAGKKGGIYCNKHKLDDMIDVLHKTCSYDGCSTQPSYNFAGKKGGIYCNKHKLDDMIDVLSKTCGYEACFITKPSYNFAGEKQGIYCVTHKLNDMIDVIHKTCKSDWCSIIPYNKKYDGYCLFCYINLFPDKPVSRNYKTKEYAVIEFIKTKFPNLNFIADKIVSDGCSRRRPDLFLDILYQIIIIEIDENQHTDYDCFCENKRIMELSQDLGHRPIVFIRFNPDDYKKDGKNITSCWGQNKNGICVVKKSKQKEWLERLNTLEDQIKYWTDPENMTDKTIEIIHLYYDVFL